jgi:hypothetical protein
MVKKGDTIISPLKPNTLTVDLFELALNNLIYLVIIPT